MEQPPPSRLITRRRLITAGGGLLVGGTAGLSYAAYIEPAVRLVVTDYHLTPPGWPDDFPLTIAVVSDVHAGGPNMPLARIEAMVDLVNSLNADLIVHLGDHEATHPFITEHVPPDAWAGALKRLAAPLGFYSILGNHDWWFNRDAVRAAVLRAGIPILENDALHLEKDGRKFWLGGIGDQIAYYIAPYTFRGVDDLPGTIAKMTTDDPAILLIHEPDIFVRVPTRISLTLAGHTHGGQINIKGLPNPFVPSQYGDRFRYGHIVEEGRHMIVSGGLGTSKVPVRFGVPPEIVMVTLGRH
ncbi:metallophosphoesterase [Agaricicola taiwanensis]|uniref:Metallophosphoesterase n=1 Tax=Agaricicola taiwanensis TaxID=591372 RepID=A0A8J2YGK7_9RHOB|nr:metallophosphoesterase [Agaricicola taiwanensis]GGE35861.1 metallophosphoesterase [Agaricicola taiwanensis]